MICERVKEQLAEYLSGNLEGAAREKFAGHLEQCATCRREVEELGALWRGLEFLPPAQPHHNMRGRFQEVLEAYEFGLQQKEKPRPRYGWWQVAAACALIGTGVTVGRVSVAERSSEVAQLRGEVENMRQLMTLSLLQQQSAGQRLKGVTYSYQMDRPDPQVEEALLYAVSHDSNVNVRLSAVDALQKYARDPQVSKALVEALEPQDSPLVQIALIDLLVDAREDAVVPELRKLEREPVNEAVKQRAGWGLQKLGVL
jgi:hypothetical protein